MNVLLTLAVIASLMFVYISFVHIVPNALMSIFRQRLWKLRDELAAEVRANKFQNEEPAECMIELIERFIRLAPEFSAARVGLAKLLTRMSHLPRPVPMVSFEGLQGSEEQLLHSYGERFSATITKHILFETPSGWVFIAVSVVLAPILVPLRIWLERDREERPRLSEDVRERVTESAKELARSNRFVPA